MQRYLSIGDFARATHLSVKTLHYYHRAGLLKPAEVDPHTGYRRYTTAQISTAQIIRRFRDLDMPVEQVARVLTAPDLDTRNDLIAAHLTRLEIELLRTRTAVDSLRDLLDRSATINRQIHRRQIPATPAAAVTEPIDATDALAWHHGALGELYATLTASNLTPAGPPGGVFADDLFTHGHGDATIFIPCAGPVRPIGRVIALTVPPAELAMIVHHGDQNDIDLSYGALATHVTTHALAVDGPIREYYLVTQRDNPDPTAWRTEIGWPVFLTGPNEDAHPRTDAPQ